MWRHGWRQCGYGSFVLTSGTWTYTLDQSPLSRTWTPVTWSATRSRSRPADGSTQQITVSITGADDASVITGTVTGAVTEGNIGDAAGHGHRLDQHQRRGCNDDSPDYCSDVASTTLATTATAPSC